MTMSHALILSDAAERKSASEALLSLQCMSVAAGSIYPKGAKAFGKFAKQLQKACTPKESRVVTDQQSALTKLRDRMKGNR